MKPREKAEELYSKMYGETPVRAVIAEIEEDKQCAKKCALIAVDLHLEELSKMKLIFSDREIHYKFWKEVKQEIEKL